MKHEVFSAKEDFGLELECKDFSF